MVPVGQADREAIFDYIEADSPQAAITVGDRIRQQVEELMKFPKIGRPGRIDGTRELSFSAHRRSPSTASQGKRYASCVCCTAPRCGRKSYPENAGCSI